VTGAPEGPSEPPATDFSAVADAIDAAGADAFVHVGDRFDDDMRYLARFGGPDRAWALVVAEGRAVLCAPALFEGQATREFADRGVELAREVWVRNVGDHAGERAATALAELSDGDAVLVPPGIPHDAVAYLERAGYEVSATHAVAEARETKTDAEVACHRAAQAAAVAGMRRAEAVLAAATPEPTGTAPAGVDATGDPDRGVLRWEGGPLTTERLRRAVNAELAARGVSDAGNSVVGAGPTAADLHYVGDDVVRPGETVLLDLSPRGPHGHYADVTRTFVVDGDGGWERRAYVAVEAAHAAALAEVEPGATASTVDVEAAAELSAHGFDPNAGGTEAGFTHSVGHGVGVSLHEAPSLTSGTALRPGHVITIEPGVYDPERGGVRLEDLVVVTEDGADRLATCPFEMTPDRRDG